MDHTALRFKKATVHFIYSFLTDPLSKVPAGFRRGKSPERRSVPPSLNVKTNEIYKTQNYGKVKITLPSCNDKQGQCLTPKLFSQIRIFETGVGTLTFSVELNPSDYKKKLMTSVDIFNIYNLINMGFSETYHYPLIQAKEWEYEDIRLIDILMRCFDEFKKANNAKVYCIDCNIVDTKDRHVDIQDPHVLLSAQVVEDSQEEAWWNAALKHINTIDKESKRKLKELILLLFRYNKGKEILLENDGLPSIPLPYDKNEIKRHLRNYSWFENIFVGSHPRATIILSTNSRKTTIKKVPSFVMESALDLIEIVRSRWHFGVIINELLNKDIKEINDMPAVRSAEFAEDVLARRKLFALYLNDPLTYSFNGSLVYELLELLKNNFQLDYLKDVTANKFEVLDRIMNDLMRASLYR